MLLSNLLTNCLGRQAAQLRRNVAQQLHLPACFTKGKEEKSSETLWLLRAVSLIIVHPYTCSALRKIMKMLIRYEWHIMMHELEKEEEGVLFQVIWTGLSIQITIRKIFS